MSDAKGGSLTPWLIGGAVLLVIVLLLKRGSGVTTIGGDTGAAEALQAKRLEAGGSAFAALAGAFGAQAAAQAQAQSNIAVANAQRDAAIGQADSQRRAAESANHSSFWGNLFGDIAPILGAVALL